MNVRAGHDSYWNSHAGFSGTYASQFAVTGLGAVKGAADMLADEILKLGAAVLGAESADEVELDGGFVRRKDNHEAALPFMACGAIVNANNAVLPLELRDITLNCRYVYVPPHQLPDKERKYGNLTLTYANQIHACVVEVDPETGVYELVDYGAVDDCGVRINPLIVEGQVHGAAAQSIGAATHEIFPYDEDGNLLTPNFYDYHVPHALDMPPLKTAYSSRRRRSRPSARRGWAKVAARGSARWPRRSRTHCAAQAKPIVSTARTPTTPSGSSFGTRTRAGSWSRSRTGEGPGRARRSPRRGRRCGVSSGPGADGGPHAACRELRRRGRPPLEGQRQDPARTRLAEDVDQVREAGGAGAGVLPAAGEGNRAWAR